MKYKKDFRYDLEVGVTYERRLGEILNKKKIEVKTDFKALKTGNVFVEYECRGRPSGLCTTEADYYCFFISDTTFIMIETEKLKEVARFYWNTPRNTKGGDHDLSKGILIPINSILI